MFVRFRNEDISGVLLEYDARYGNSYETYVRLSANSLARPESPVYLLLQLQGSVLDATVAIACGIDIHAMKKPNSNKEPNLSS
ncbi:hypothetical protein BIW11_04220 [Tropilaelaps mercedesae]|uniref:Uncharacterized protein n=1 Tax=Tropilaelaps mercedesae TaxID=418985 RepID=A0A1V9X9L4_9ACAR|nr:hypothetical protein BIW11_04220 [Tropilaelaps mercedesae]